jgi:hypothetical protein
MIIDNQIGAFGDIALLNPGAQNLHNWQLNQVKSLFTTADIIIGQDGIGRHHFVKGKCVKSSILTSEIKRNYWTGRSSSFMSAGPS